MSAGTQKSTAPAFQYINGRLVVNTTATSQDPPAVGRHRLKIEKVDAKESGPDSKNPGQPYLSARLRIIDGPDAGKTVWQNLQLEGGFRFLFENLSKAVGLANVEDLELEMFEGREFEATLKHRTWNDRVNAEIDKIFYDDDSTSTPSASTAGSFPF